MVKIEREIPIQIDPGENPFLRGIFAPISTEITADDLKVIGEIPKDLDGAYLRNGPNPIFQFLMALVLTAGSRTPLTPTWSFTTVMRSRFGINAVCRTSSIRARWR